MKRERTIELTTRIGDHVRIEHRSIDERTYQAIELLKGSLPLSNEAAYETALGLAPAAVEQLLHAGRPGQEADRCRAAVRARLFLIQVENQVLLGDAAAANNLEELKRFLAPLWPAALLEQLRAA